MPSPTQPRPRPLFSPFGLLLAVLFLLAALTAALSTRGFVKRYDLPPPGTYLVIAGQENPLFVKLAQKSIKGYHRAEGVRGQLDVPGETMPRPLLVRSENSSEWQKWLKIPPLAPGAKATDIESHIVVLLRASIPSDPKLYGLTVPATFDLAMVVPRLNPDNPRLGIAAPDHVSWTMPLQIKPPGFLRLYQRINRIALWTAGAVLVVAFVRQMLLRRSAARTDGAAQ